MSLRFLPGHHLRQPVEAVEAATSCHDPLQDDYCDLCDDLPTEAEWLEMVDEVEARQAECDHPYGIHYCPECDYIGD